MPLGRKPLPKQRPDIGPGAPLFYRFDFKPIAWQRKLTKISTVNHILQSWNPPDLTDYESRIRKEANAQHCLAEPFTADLACIISFRLPHRRHGDLDNMVKAILDGMTPLYEDGQIKTMGVFRSDKVIKKLVSEIHYSAHCEPCSEVIIYRHGSRAWSARLHVGILRIWERMMRLITL